MEMNSHFLKIKYSVWREESTKPLQDVLLPGGKLQFIGSIYNAAIAFGDCYGLVIEIVTGKSPQLIGLRLRIRQ